MYFKINTNIDEYLIYINMVLAGRILWKAFTCTNYIKGICSYCGIYFSIFVSGLQFFRVVFLMN